MTAVTVALPTTDEIIAAARKGIEQAMLDICLLGDALTSEQRHPIRDQLHVAMFALGTYQNLRAKGVRGA